MNPPVIQFQCNACQAHLTVPAHLAGVTGPCPKCGHTITSPAVSSPVNTEPLPQQPAPPPASAPVMPAQAPASAAWPNAPATLPGAPSNPPPSPAPPSQPAAVWGGAPSAGQPPAPAPTLLPPRRAEPEPAPLPEVMQSPAPPVQSGAPTPTPRSSLIPGAPALPVMEIGGDNAQGTSANGSLLNSLLSSPGAMPSVAPPQTAISEATPEPTAADAPAPASSGESLRQPLPPFPKKPGRGSNLVRFGIAVLLLLACVALLGYVGRQPLKDLYYRHLAPLVASSSEPDVVEAAPEASSSTPTALPEPPPPSVTEKETPADSALNPPLPGQLAPGDPLTEPPTAASSMQASASAPAITPVPEDPDASGPMTEIKRAAPALPEDLAVSTPAPAPKPPDSLIEVPTTMDRTSPPAGTPEITVPDEAKPAAKALMEFLSSDSLDGKRRFILGVDDPQIKALVERYYGQADPGAIPITSISLLRHDPNPEVGGGMQSVFMVASPDWTYPIPVMLQETKQGFKLDWIAFIEFKDNMLLKFVQAYRDNPSRFHVSIKRSHYFERDVPDLENKDCFIIQPPQEDFEVSVFVPKNSPLADKLRHELSWSTQFAYVLAEIQWRDDGTHQWIELTAVPQLNWYITTDTPGAAQEAK